MKKIIIVGCGLLGRKVGEQAILKGHDVVGIVSGERSIKKSRLYGIDSCQLDLDSDYKKIDLDLDDSIIFYFVPPQKTGTEDSRISRFLKKIRLDRLPNSFNLISVSSVYGDCQGQWVSEETNPAPVSDRSKRRLSAEKQLQRWVEGKSTGYCILRVAGIYGPDRLPIQRIKSKQPVLDIKEAPFSNRIHEEDLVNSCLSLLEKRRLNTVINIADDTPTSMTDYFFSVADALKIPRPPTVGLKDSAGVISAGMLSYLTESRRIKNTKMKELLNIQLKYPSLKQGLAAL